MPSTGMALTYITVRKFVGERIYLPQTVAATFANQSFSTVVPINAHSYNKAKVIKLKKP